jgi:hypothetical protein
MSNSSNSSTIVLTLKDEVSSCTFAVIAGAVHQIISGGIDAAQVLRKSNANLTGSDESIIDEVVRAFNANGSDYVATLEDTRRATIYEAGNGLPGFADTVLADDEIWQIVTPDSDLRISTNGSGQGNSIEATLVAVGNQCDLTDDQWDNVYDGSVVLHAEEAPESEDYDEVMAEDLRRSRAQE